MAHSGHSCWLAGYEVLVVVDWLTSYHVGI